MLYAAAAAAATYGILFYSSRLLFLFFLIIYNYRTLLCLNRAHTLLLSDFDRYFHPVSSRPSGSSWNYSLHRNAVPCFQTSDSRRIGHELDRNNQQFELSIIHGMASTFNLVDSPSMFRITDPIQFNRDAKLTSGGQVKRLT